MSTLWLITAVVIICIFKVNCQNISSSQNVNNGGFAILDTLFGFKPCLDESCENYGPSVLDPKEEPEKVEQPRAHCMLLKPSAVKQFGELENAHTDIKDVKYRVLEEMIEYMHSLTSLEVQNCKPAMKLIDIIILAANALRTQYIQQGGEECMYENPEDKTDIPVGSDYAGDVPCKPEVSGDVMGMTTCAGKTITPELQKPTEKPYVPSPTEKHVTDKNYIPTSTMKPELQKPTEKPYVRSTTEKHAADKPYAPGSISEYETACPDGVTTEKPCPHSSGTVTEEYSSTEEIEIIAEEDENSDVPQVGSMRGIPGVHYPNYIDIPITAFTCADKKYIPGFYADLETACQVFHVCYEHRRESFLCPVGTTFNQPILACDYWYSSNCSLAPYYYDVNERSELKEDKIDTEVEELLTEIAESKKTDYPGSEQRLVESDLDKVAQFFPVKAVVTETKPDVQIPIEPNTEKVASAIVDQMATTATKVISHTRGFVKSIPEPEPAYKPVEPSPLPVLKKPVKMDDLLKGVVAPFVMAKLAAVPISKATALKTAVPVATLASKSKITIPVAAKAKLATKVATIPAIKSVVPVLAKTKVAAAALPATKTVVAPAIVKAKVASAAAPAKIAVSAPFVAAKGKMVVPAFKMAATKVAASSIPVFKTKTASTIPLAKNKLPFMKAKAVKTAGTPLLKAKMVALPLTKSKVVPLSKVKLAKAAAISPLTKKALALGYMKLLKAKKFALMG